MICAYCEEPIEASEQQSRFNEISEASGWLPKAVAMHRACFVRSIVGSVGHQQRRCSCYGFEDVSEIGLTPRAAAREAARHFALAETLRRSAN
jgi:hypothetical protein